VLTFLRKKTVVVLVSLVPLIAAILLFGFLAKRHVSDRGTVLTDSHPLPKPAVIIRNFTYSRTLHSMTRWFVRAKSATVGEDHSRTRLSELSAHIILNSSLMLDIRSQKGIIDQPGHQFLVSGRSVPVSAAFSSGLLLVARQLHYHDASDTITTEGPVTLVSRGVVIYGIGLTSVPKTQSFTLARNVHAVFAG
jgi:LPS export ABC transporter protein LptC